MSRKPKDWPAEWPLVPIHDAELGVTLEIRPRDTKHAVPRDPENCAVARSGRRHFNSDVVAVRVGATVVYVLYAEHAVRYFLATETRQMIRAYDEVEFFPSGVYAKLLPPPLTKRLGAQPKSRPSGKLDGTRSVVTVRPWLRHIGQVAAA